MPADVGALGQMDLAEGECTLRIEVVSVEPADSAGLDGVTALRFDPL